MSAPMDSSPTKLTLKTRIIVFTTLSAIIIAIALSSIAASGTTAPKKTKLKAETVRLADVANDTPNPTDGYMFCENPIFTIALMIDRSGSVSGIAENPVNYKKSINLFLDDLYNELVVSRHGQVNVILFAFGARSVIQNPTTSSGELITSISDAPSLEVMKNSVERIFFTKGSWSDDASTLSADTSNPYDVARGYNAGSVSEQHEGMGGTNWDDALQDVAKIGKSPAFSSFERGKHIDLALMLTDGEPNINNDENRTFEIADIQGSDHSNRSFLIDDVKELRTGIPGVRPPMDVRGLLINANADENMNLVFGEGSQNWTKATNFKEDLQDVLDALLASIDTDEECSWIPIYPKMSVRVLSSSHSHDVSFELVEGVPDSNWLIVEICNLTEHLPLKDPKWMLTLDTVTERPDFGMPYVPLTEHNELAPAGEPNSCAEFKASVGDVPLGGGQDGSYKFWSWGTVTPTKKYRLASDSGMTIEPDKTVILEDIIGIDLVIKRLSLPA